MSSLLERLHAKFNQNRPWSETIKLVRQVMVSIGKVLRITAQLYTTHAESLKDALGIVEL
jgi:mediator of RNA polymerase II transcription subunit 1